MPKAYWVTCYREITDPAKLAAYGKLAAPAIEGAGGHFLARANAVYAYEAGQLERTSLRASRKPHPAMTAPLIKLLSKLWMAALFAT